jgi:hypothetical protein
MFSRSSSRPAALSFAILLFSFAKGRFAPPFPGNRRRGWSLRGMAKGLLCVALAALTLPETNAQTVATSTVPTTGTSPFNTNNINNIAALGGIAVDSSGNVFVSADLVNNINGNGEILEFTPTTTTPPFTYNPTSFTTITITAGTQCMLPNRLPGDANPTAFGFLNQMTVDKDDNIWVTDNTGPVWEIPKGSTSANCITNISQTSGSNSVIPVGIAVDSNLNVFVSDNSNNVIREYLNSETYSTAHIFNGAKRRTWGSCHRQPEQSLCRQHSQ